MALDKRINDFGEISDLNDTDMFLVAAQNGTYRISFGALNHLLEESSNEKVNVFQGTSNYGKILVVNSSGNVDLGDAPVIRPLTITRNGIYTPTRRIDGYGPIEVNVSGGGGGGGGGGEEWVTYETSVTVVTD